MILLLLHVRRIEEVAEMVRGVEYGSSREELGHLAMALYLEVL